ncbi:MAG: bifunctional phosphopantothenoylcysteine decarboxylase/phosphopantothenate--cysteine ligase CoaBC [Pseudomonadota bacterium]
MSHLAQKHIVLGITGSIAAYKSPDLVRRLRAEGADVRVAMTASGTHFVTPLTFQAVSSQPVHLDLLDPAAEAAMGHIELARWADLILIAPASADFIARLAHGHANDLLSTLCLATEAPIAIAPAMNRVMWTHPATQENCAKLQQRGVHIFGPGAGEQACGEVGDGRMLEPHELVSATDSLFARPGMLSGKTVMVTAGPTYEDIDPVRYIGNRSSGKMGYAIAEAARAAGAKVVLVSGPVALQAPAGIETVRVRSAHDMHEYVMYHLDGVDVFISAAAVADYRPTVVSDTKIKKNEHELCIDLIRNPDILRAVAALPDGPYTVGFAAETHDLEMHAKKKLVDKRLDLICANQVGGPDAGFESDRNALQLYWKDGARLLSLQDKASLARELIAFIAEQLGGR